MGGEGGGGEVYLESGGPEPDHPGPKLGTPVQMDLKGPASALVTLLVYPTETCARPLWYW